MKIGYFGARADFRGLAIQSQGFCKWLQPDRVWCIDMHAEDLSPYPNEFSPFDGFDLTVTTRSALHERSVRRWLRGLDVVIGAETFYADPFPDWARDSGVKTVLQINAEFQVWHLPDTPRLVKPSRPDVLIAPTTWMLDKMPGVIHLPFPVDREMFPFRLRTQAEHFVHPAGHRAAQDRAGTRLVFAAVRRLPDTRLTIRSQSELGLEVRRNRNPEFRVEISNLADPRDLYANADVVVLPRRYGGQSLTVNEALSCGIPVIMLNREPENSWGGVVTLPSQQRRHFNTHFGALQWFDSSPQYVAQTIERLKREPVTVQELSEQADAYAETIGWNRMLPIYMDFFRMVKNGEDSGGLQRGLESLCRSSGTDLESAT